MNQDKKNKGYPLYILIVALVIVFALSWVPWGKITGNFIKDFNLLSDLMPADSIEATGASNEVVDPALLCAIAADSIEQRLMGNAQALTDSMAMALTDYVADSIAEPQVEIIDFNPRINGEMVIEDYTPDSRGLSRLKSAVASGRVARVAVVGDSYIEGDIFTQDLRQQLQSLYGGGGVGYMPAHSQVSGFRQTVRQSDSGWTRHAMSQSANNSYYNLTGEYFTAKEYATITYKGNKKDARLATWNQSLLLFVAKAAGVISVTTDNGPVECQIGPSDDVQAITVDGETSMLKIECNVPGLVFLGAWLDDKPGVAVDCMSVRGDSGITHRKINQALAEQMRQWVDYDLIILEYGINALTAEQRDYGYYSRYMQQVVQRVRECYPSADILLMGIGDRGQKIGGTMHSMSTAPYMVKAQRQAAKAAQCLFWDTREAMGGQDAVVRWRERKLINGDYIHLNGAGGQELATELMKSLKKMLDE